MPPQCLGFGIAGSQSGCDVAIHPQLTATRLANFTRALIDFQATQTCILLVPFQRTQDLAMPKRFSPSCRVQTRFFVWKIQEP